MVDALEDLPEGALANLLDDLEAEADLVVLADAVVTVRVVVTVVHDALCLSRVDLVFICCEVVDLLKLGDLLLL